MLSLHVSNLSIAYGIDLVDIFGCFSYTLPDITISLIIFPYFTCLILIFLLYLQLFIMDSNNSSNNNMIPNLEHRITMPNTYGNLTVQLDAQNNMHMIQAPTTSSININNTLRPELARTANHSRIAQPWHNNTPEIVSIRQSICTSIMELLSQRRNNNATPEWRERLPQMANRLEEALYHSSNNLNDYSDMTTLKARLQQLAALMNNNKASANKVQPPTENNVHSINHIDIKSTLSQPQPIPVKQAAPVLLTAVSNANTNAATVVTITAPATGGSSNIITPAPTNTQEEHRKQVLKQQQQRLLLLRHASKCPHDNCPVTPYCASMKLLWKHIMSCKDQECKVPHCVSSRYVLSHYSKCRETQCPVCAPVRDAIRKNYEKNRDVIQKAQTNTMDVNNRVTKKEGQAAKKGKYTKTQELVPIRNDPPVVVKPRIPQLLDPVSCAMYSFTKDEVEAHFRNIHIGMKSSNTRIREICMPPLDEVMKQPNCLSIFGWPVDYATLGLHDYPLIVKFPMDLGSIKKKLETNSYRELQQFVSDVYLTFDNAMLYNAKGTFVHDFAKNLKKIFDTRYKASLVAYERKQIEARSNPQACLFCGEVLLKFEPPVYYCNGKCGGQRIRRNAFYYSAGNNSYHWCSPCFSELRDDQPIRMLDCTLIKSEIAKSRKKHDEDAEEIWVQCSDCSHWAHSVCALFNLRRNLGDQVEYCCPHCLTLRRQKQDDSLIIMQTNKKTQAKDLPQNVLSQFLERKINMALERAYRDTADKRGIPIDSVEKCGEITVRVVASYDKDQHVREGVFNAYKHKNYPEAFPCRVKCIVLFEKIDGQATLLFGMYVYEYGHKCPDPNQRRCYISYLDSVHYFRPRQFRTLVYHEIIVSYLDYMKRRGFHTVHIWACPPLKGDDYILHVHPQDQKTPKDDKLRKWYVDILHTCRDRGIITEISDLFTEYLVNTTYDATVLPYFEGDYWVSEAEVILKNIKEGKNVLPINEGIDDNAGEKSKRKVDRKKKTERIAPATRGSVASTGGLASDRDPILAKLATIIEPMKDAFFVARLHPAEYAEKWRKVRSNELLNEKSETSAEESSLREKKLQEEVLSDKTITVPTIAHVSKTTASGKSKVVDLAQVTADANSTELSVNEEKDSMDEEDDFATSVAGITSGNSDAMEMSEALENTNSLKRVHSMMDSIDSKSASLIKSESNQDFVEMPVNSEIVENAKFQSKEMTSSSKVRGRPRTKAPAVQVSAVVTATTDNSMPMETDESKALANTLNVLNSVNSSSVDHSIKVKAEVDPAKIEADAAFEAELAQKYSIDDLVVNIKDDTEDVDDIIESDHWDTRLTFLNLCQGNHYQFDNLRRVKHTSMMILYHLHNPDAPKFVPECSVASCHKDILENNGLHCRTCDLHFCNDCYHALGGPRIHQHQLRTLGDAASNAPQQLTEQQRKDRQKNLQMHLQLLHHSANLCINNPLCVSRNCMQMKKFLEHELTCPIKVQKGCPQCKKMYSLLQLHARSCRIDNCKVPNCAAIRDHMRQMEQRQQKMDDRRRSMMNDIYLGGSGRSNEETNDDNND